MGGRGRSGRASPDPEKAADPAAARLAGIGMLARREYSSGELSAALLRKGFAQDAITAAVEELRSERLLDDERYAASLVRMLAGRGQGPARIRQELAAASLPAALVDSTLAESGQDWAALAREVRRRKFGAERPGEWPERARQMRFLQYRGFSTDHIGSALGGSGVDDTDP